jgi:hypothetical protein
VEIIKQYHTQNTVKVQQVVSDAMKQLSEILEVNTNFTKNYISVEISVNQKQGIADGLCL